MTRTLAMLVVVGMLVGAVQSGEAAEGKTVLEGKWQMVSGEFPGGQAPPEEFIKSVTLTCEGDKLVFKAGGDDKKGTFKIDDKQKPKHFDVTRDEDGKTMKGIYSLEKEELKICIGEPTDERPAEFKAKGGSAVMIFKRAK